MSPVRRVRRGPTCSRYEGSHEIVQPASSYQAFQSITILPSFFFLLLLLTFFPCSPIRLYVTCPNLLFPFYPRLSVTHFLNFVFTIVFGFLSPSTLKTCLYTSVGNSCLKCITETADITARTHVS